MVMTPTDEPMKAQMQTNDLTLPDIEQLLKATENKAPVKGHKVYAKYAGVGSQYSLSTD